MKIYLGKSQILQGVLERLIHDQGYKFLRALKKMTTIF